MLGTPSFRDMVGWILRWMWPHHEGLPTAQLVGENNGWALTMAHMGNKKKYLVQTLIPSPQVLNTPKKPWLIAGSYWIYVRSLIGGSSRVATVTVPIDRTGVYHYLWQQSRCPKWVYTSWSNFESFVGLSTSVNLSNHNPLIQYKL